MQFLDNKFSIVYGILEGFKYCDAKIDAYATEAMF